MTRDNRKQVSEKWAERTLVCVLSSSLCFVPRNTKRERGPTTGYFFTLSALFLRTLNKGKLVVLNAHKLITQSGC